MERLAHGRVCMQESFSCYKLVRFQDFKLLLMVVSVATGGGGKPMQQIEAVQFWSSFTVLGFKWRDIIGGKTRDP